MGILSNPTTWILLISSLLAGGFVAFALWRDTEGWEIAAFCVSFLATFAIVGVSIAIPTTDYFNHRSCEIFAQETGLEIEEYTLIGGCYVNTPNGVMTKEKAELHRLGGTVTIKEATE